MLIYNGCSLFVRLANPGARLEAITSRPWLMSSVGRRTEHAGQTRVTLSALHTRFDKAREVLMQVSRLLKAWVVEAAEQLEGTSVWAFAVRISRGYSPALPHRPLLGWQLCHTTDNCGC
ncbi:hypothetical protein GCM10027514_43340 [Azotobacter armeniacus]